ncbi:MAG TPA: hypothetical protein VF290_02565 [Pyrinomonadaceae bacterium]
MRLKSGDIVRFKMEQGTLLAGMTGICRIDSFEKSQHGTVVYIDTQKEDGSFVSRFARLWPFEIWFAPVGSEQFEIYVG